MVYEESESFAWVWVSESEWPMMMNKGCSGG
jgi:hypothetical protein